MVSAGLSAGVWAFTGAWEGFYPCGASCERSRFSARDWWSKCLALGPVLFLRQDGSMFLDWRLHLMFPVLYLGGRWRGQPWRCLPLPVICDCLFVWFWCINSVSCRLMWLCVSCLYICYFFQMFCDWYSYRLYVLTKCWNKLCVLSRHWRGRQPGSPNMASHYQKYLIHLNWRNT